MTMRYLLALLLICSIAGADDFNDRGVWHPIDGITLTAGQIKAVGLRDVSDRKNNFNILIYGTTPGDSLKAWLRVYGLMGSSLADTVEMVSVIDDSSATAGNTLTYMYDFNETEDISGGNAGMSYPHIYVRLANNHADSSGVFDLYIYAKPEDITILRR